jgi:hypothetical protein
MSAPNHSKRFSSNFLTEKIIPIVLVILVTTLLSVFVIICLSLMGIIPSV